MLSSNAPGLEKYAQRLAERMLEIELTPTGRPMISWVRKRRPKILLGQPITGGGFTYPWPLDYIVISPEPDDEWLRGAVAHELVHLIQFGGPGTIGGSLEQERIATWVSAKIWTEYPPDDPTPPQQRPGYYEKAGWVLDQPPEIVRGIIRDTWGGFYKNIPELQPGPWPWQQLAAGWPQIVFGIKILLHRE
jgi:hypothetical protein